MDFDSIKELIGKYWRCETSVEEEKILRDYFSQDSIPDDLAPYADLFRFYNRVAGQKQIPVFSPDHIQESHKDSSRKKGAAKIYSPWFYRVAATVILILAFILINEQFIKNKNDTIKMARDTFQNPEEAFTETKRILLLVSNRLNKGEQGVVRIAEFSKAENIFRKPQIQLK